MNVRGMVVAAISLASATTAGWEKTALCVRVSTDARNTAFARMAPASARLDTLVSIAPKVLVPISAVDMANVATANVYATKAGQVLIVP